MLLRSYQDLVKINLAVENGSIAQARSARATLHAHPATLLRASSFRACQPCVTPPAGLMCTVCHIAQTPSLVAAFDAAKAGTGRLHLWGLLSDGGVHGLCMAARALILTLTLSPTRTPIPKRAPDPHPHPQARPRPPPRLLF